MFPVPEVVQANVAPAVELLPDKLSSVTKQVSSAVAPASAIGACTSSVITTVSVSVQPFGPVTVKVYVPGASTVGEAVFAPLTMFPVPEVVHAKVAPAVELLPDKLRLVTRQVSSAVAPASTLGRVTSSVITTVSVSVQPFGPVTVKVYVPGASTVGEAVFDPLTMFPVPEVVHAKVAPAVELLTASLKLSNIQVSPVVAPASTLAR